MGLRGSGRAAVGSPRRTPTPMLVEFDLAWTRLSPNRSSHPGPLGDGTDRWPDAQFLRKAGDWTRRRRCLPHELCRSRRPIRWQRHRADGPVPVIKGIVRPLQARKMRIALGSESKRVNGDSICILFGRSEHRQAAGRPKPRCHRSTVNDRQQLARYREPLAMAGVTPRGRSGSRGGRHLPAPQAPPDRQGCRARRWRPGVSRTR